MSGVNRILILGSGGHARSVADTIDSLGMYDIAGFVSPSSDAYRSWKTIGDDADLPRLRTQGITHAALGIGFMGGDFRKRLHLISLLKDAGFQLPAIVDKAAILASDAQIGIGTFVGKRAVVNARAHIGDGAIVNTGAIVEHDCGVGDCSHIAVGATLCGDVQVGKGAFVGAGAVVIQERRVGDSAVVGAGSVILSDVEPRQIAVGVFHAR